ncbi:response regulator [Burkholderia multivorans]|uniref:hybrid sensor histidine kinase/response regulator n=1 Tax=Burkholderia multivorans TaxID=87883 RepID=UPI001C21A436|nr:ATP-binding protein [Burkholderia multivorans]MBU9441811.1 response regulator [Burkholderia multivorans]
MRTVTRELFRQGAWVVLAVGVACALQAGAIRVVGAHAPFAPLPFYAGVAAAAWLTSLAGGLAATAASTVVIAALWWRDAPTATWLADAGTFVAIGVIECALIAAVRPLFARTRADDDANDARREPAAAPPPPSEDVLLRRVVDASPDAIVGVDGARRIVSWNRAAQRIFGADAATMIGRDVTTLFAPRWLRRQPVPASIDEVHAPLGPIDVLCMRQDAHCFRATFAASPIVDANGHVDGLSMTLREARERRRDERRDHRSLRGARDARAQADTSNRLKDELLATVSHELRTPLNVIYGWVEVLRSVDGQGFAQQAVDAIDRSARSLARMVGDLLDASSLATGKLRLERTPVDVARVLHDAAREFGAPAHAKGITLVTEGAGTACVISADAERLHQVLSNLLSNAIKFTPSGGRIVVSLARVDAHVRVSVADTGQGMAPEALPNLFDPFNRPANAPASPQRGLGLGLSIVRNIAELHGGSVEAASEGPGRGLTVTVMLPAGWDADMAVVPLSTADGVPAAALEHQRVLVVDDEPTSRASLSAALQTLGAQVSTAQSGRDALASIERDPPTVVLSDIAMPDGDGFWLIERVRRLPGRHARMPVVAVTAHAGVADRQRVMAAGFDAYLCKPVDVPTLASAIDDVTARRTREKDGPER